MDTYDRFSAALCRRVAAVRASKGLSQQDLADAAGLSLRTVQRIEAGVRDPSYREIARISVRLGASPSRFIQAAEKAAREEADEERRVRRAQREQERRRRQEGEAPDAS